MEKAKFARIWVGQWVPSYSSGDRQLSLRYTRIRASLVGPRKGVCQFTTPGSMPEDFIADTVPGFLSDPMDPIR